MLTRTLALELAPFNIRVNSISPGIIPTEGSSSTTEAIEYNKARLPRVALGRFGTPEEIGNVALFLASAASSYITGTDIEVDGGWTLT
jgi:3-oxoacyl-[acyl-carrier protein] reductase